VTKLDLVIPLLVTTVVAVLGWFAAHQLAAARDRTNKRRELRVSYLIEAFRALASASNRPSGSCAHDLESAITDIQLFGSGRQVELAHEFATQIAAKGTGELDKLLQELRRDLREELNLERASSNFTILRIKASDP
jgi:hypothetical protein